MSINKYSDMICGDLARREELAGSDLNGIDYIEVVTEPPRNNQRLLKVYFITKTFRSGMESLSDMIDELKGATDRVTIEGGVRVRNIQVKSVDRVENHLEVRVSEPSDFSIYTLVIDHPKMDIAFSRHPFSFKAGCPGDLDCQRKIDCPPEAKKEPVIDYLAKDYASFRQALLDLIPTLIPNWKERHEADLGIALVELLAYVGDQLSYYQDAVANEAYLETARQRESVRRHARLIDYNMHDGVNARTFIHVQLKEGTKGTLPAGTSVLNRILTPLGSNMMPPRGPVIPNTVRTQALSKAEVVFETVEEAALDSKLNKIKIHTWGNRLCCVPRRTTTLELEGDLPLEIGDFLLFEEVKGPERPETGLLADANPKHRQIVRLVDVKKTEDPLQVDPETGSPPLKLTQVSWHRHDALWFPLCISTQLVDATFVDNVSIARGNLVLADHGQSIQEWHPENPTVDSSAPGIRKGNIAYRFNLKNGPITFSTPKIANAGGKLSVTEIMTVDPRKARASASLEIHEDGPAGSRPQWKVVSHLLDSRPFDRHFVMETKNDGRAIIRFGHDQLGMDPPEESHLEVTYRVGNGAAGNVGVETLVHILEPDPLIPDWPHITGVRNPLPAVGGIDPETLDQAKHLAPKAFHAEQFRAVSEEDYARATEKHQEVDKAVATFRWTGSWHTVFITVDPSSSTDLTPDLETRIRSHITRYRLAGYDIEIDPPIYIPLEIEINICVARDHFRAHVKEAVLEALSNQVFPNGGKGFFHTGNFTFGQPVYISRLYEALEQIKSVDSAEVVLFKRLGEAENHELDKGYIPMGRLEIACLDNDPNFPENGVLRLNMMGGK